MEDFPSEKGDFSSSIGGCITGNTEVSWNQFPKSGFSEASVIQFKLTRD
jgi:hypothetical protein